MRILIITDYVPYPPISGDCIRVYNIIRQLAKDHQVTMATLTHDSDAPGAIEHMRQFCDPIITGSIKEQSKLAHLPGIISFALQGKPLELKFLYSADFVNGIRDIVNKIEFDIIQIEQSRMAFYLDILPKTIRNRTVLSLHNIAFDQYKSIYKILPGSEYKLRSWLFYKMMLQWEPRVAQRFARCVAVSEDDRRILLEANPQLKADVIPNGVDTHQYQPLLQTPSEPALLFIGSMVYAPCVDAAVYFCQEILPLIRREYKDIHVWLVGREPAAEVRALNSPTVHVTGQVDDILPYYQRSNICIVPLRAGGGTRLKILEAMALGKPVVTTSIGCEGLDVEHEKHLLIADNPEDFAHQVIRLLQDKELAQRLCTEARQLVVNQYDWEVITNKLVDVYKEVLADRQ